MEITGRIVKDASVFKVKENREVVNFSIFFTFKFLSPSEINQKVTGRKHVSFYVYVKENFEWNPEKRTKENEFRWTSADTERYGNLTVIRIKVIERLEN